MKQPSKVPRPEDHDLYPLEDEESDEPTLDATDDQPYSDEFLDAFLSEDYADRDLESFDFGDPDSDGSDGDAEFDRYFRNADSHSRARRRRRHRGQRSWREAFEYEPGDSPDWGHHRRPRR